MTQDKRYSLSVCCLPVSLRLLLCCVILLKKWAKSMEVDVMRG